MYQVYLVTLGSGTMQKISAESMTDVFVSLECKFGIHADDVVNIELVLDMPKVFHAAKFSELTGIPFHKITYNEDSDTYTVDLNA